MARLVEDTNPPPRPKAPPRLVEEPFEFSAAEMARNVPGSAWQLAKDVTAPIHSPIQTAKGVWKAGSGLAQLGIPGEQGNEPYARAVGQGLKERYGGRERLARTLQNDPVGLVSDVAGLLTGGATLAARQAPRAAAIAGQVGRNLDPVVATQRVLGAAVPRNVPRAMTESALKLGTTMNRPDRARVVETVLEHKVLPTEGGVRKLHAAQEALGDEIDTLIQQAGQRGGSIPAMAVFADLKQLRQRLGGPTLAAADDLRAIDSVARDYMLHLQRIGQKRLTVEDLQRLKTDAYRRINFNRSQQKAAIGTEEAYKSVARTARQEIEKKVPEIAAVNRRYGDIEHSLPAVERAANRISNRDILGIGVPIKTGAGAALAGGLGGLAGIATGLLDTPVIKARLAHMIEALRKKGYVGGAVPTSRTGTRAIAAQAGRLQDDPEAGGYAYPTGGY
jgi:hypothetical protein